MNARWSRRRFLQTTAAALPGLAVRTPSLGAETKVSAAGSDFSFVLLGDLHLDKLAHHDLGWLRAEKPADVRQVQDYSRITAELTPRLLAALRQTIAELNQAAVTPVRFIIQTGDLVEGLCGNPELARRHCEEWLGFIRQQLAGTPFLTVKGNHDITGPGAVEAYDQVVLPFLAGQLSALKAGAKVSGANFAFETGGMLFIGFDAYDRRSLDHLDQALGRSAAERVWLMIHPPVVPYGARAAWHIFAKPEQQASRNHLLKLLAARKAIVLTGHIHRFNCLVREAPGGRFLQLATSSVIPQAEVRPKTVLEGVKEYTPAQIEVEPNFSPETAAERRAILAAEAPFVKHFEYADLPGYTVVTVKAGRVHAAIYPGFSREPWRTLDFSGLVGD